MYCVWWLKFFFFLPPQITLLCFPDGSAGKESTCNAGLIPRLGRSPGEGKGYPLQYSGLENSMGTIQSMGSQIVSHDWMSDFHFLYKNKSDSGLFQQKRNLLKGCSVRFSSVAQSCPTLCDPMDCSTPGLPVHHQPLELAQTHVHQVCDAIQPSHPLSSPSPTFHLSQHQGLFQWVISLHQVAKVLEFQLQHQSFQWIFRTDFL